MTDVLQSILEKLPAEEQAQLKQLLESQQHTEALHRELIRKLNQAMALNRVVLNAAGEGIIAIDENHRIVDFNPALANMFGYTERELKGQNLNMLLPREVHGEHADKMRKFGEQPQTRVQGFGKESKVYGVHKTKGPFRVSVAVSHGLKDGEKIYTGIIRDLTQQDRLEQENAIQAQQLVNRAKEFEGLYRLSKLGEEDSVPAILDKLFKDIVPTTTKYPEKAVTIVELDGQTYRSRTEPPVVSISSKLHNGKVTFGFTADIPYGTSQHQRLLDMFAAELDLIIMRTKARQRDLQIERKTATDELKSGVAHNINNGLQIIQGYSQVALGLADSDEVREPLEKIRKMTRELGATVRGILKSSDYEPDQVNFETFDLGEALRAYLAGAENPLKSLALHQGTTVTINKHIGADAIVHGDKEDITLIAQVLIKNSIDSLVADGQISIDVRRAGDSVHLQVKDTGKGMDRETRQKLFDRYFTTKDPRSRTGLGLSNARRIALKHGGDIRLVHSKVGVGTTMELMLPYARQQASIGPAGHQQREHLNILWAEDDIVIQETVKTMTRSFTDHIDFAQNGKIALDMLQRKPYDVLITDVGMPIMGGWKLLKCIAGRYDNMTRVIASGYVISSTDMNASGASYLLNKPLDKNDLAAVLETIKTGPRVSRQNGISQSAYHH